MFSFFFFFYFFNLNFGWNARKGKKLSQNRLFNLFKKIKSLVLPYNSLKWQCPWFFNSLWTLHAQKNVLLKLFLWAISRFQFLPIFKISWMVGINFNVLDLGRNIWKEQGKHVNLKQICNKTPNNASANGIWGFFNLQYFLNKIISEFSGCRSVKEHWF